MRVTNKGELRFDNNLTGLQDHETRGGYWIMCSSDGRIRHARREMFGRRIIQDEVYEWSQVAAFDPKAPRVRSCLVGDKARVRVRGCIVRAAALP